MAVALYARVSTGRQAETDLSIPDQLRQMREWCKGNGYTIAREYVEPGASATDDKRPVYQEMMADALRSPSPYEAIIVHSFSRFFRSSVGYALAKRDLRKVGARVISISQPTSDDPSGELLETVLSAVDQHSSQENAKHTLRAMQENARRGFWNGSRAPFGYRTVETEETGNKGSRKKRLAVHEAEALTVRQIGDLYMTGLSGRPMGMKDIVTHLNGRGVLMRGKPWRIQQVQEILSNTVYAGTAYFNRYDTRAKRPKPASDWIAFEVPAIIDAETWKRVADRRAKFQLPKVTRADTSPTLLTGILRCGRCGAGMTLATGKSGEYRYYKCNTRISKGKDMCDCPNIPCDTLDALVLAALADKAFAPDRLKAIIAELARSVATAKGDDERKLKALQSELKAVEARRDRLLDSVERGALPVELVAERGQRIKAQRESLMMQMGALNGRRTMPLRDIQPRHVDAFGKALRARLMDGKAGLARPYLRLLVDEVRVGAGGITVRGDSIALARAVIQNAEGALSVPRTVPLRHAISPLGLSLAYYDQNARARGRAQEGGPHLLKVSNAVLADRGRRAHC